MEILTRHRASLLEALEELLKCHPSPSPLLTMCRYHMGLADVEGKPTPGGAGKMLRPALCLEVCEALGGDFHQCLPPALALELIHRTSLVFDDIQDNSPERNHQATVWDVWGVDQALNAGLTLSAYSRLAFHGMLAAGSPAELTLRVDDLLERGVIDLCRGQYMDLHFQRVPPSLEEYMEMVRLKTGVLMGLSCEVGALVAGQSPEVQKEAQAFGETLGVAFQLQDDVLGVWGEAGETGKVANDLEERKWGLPAVLAMREDPSVARYLATSSEDHEATEELRDLLGAHRVQAKAELMAGDIALHAERLVKDRPFSNGRILELVGFVTRRSV